MSELSTSHPNEDGAILILLVLLSVCLITFAAIVIDLGSYGNERQQAQHYADLSALAALEAHYAANDASLVAPPLVLDLKDRIQSAVNRASSVSQTNVLLSARTKSAKLFNPDLNATGTGAELIPGRWWGALPPDGTDPCAGTYPCFRRITNINAVPEPQVTAYQVRGKIFEKFSTKLARFFFGIDSFPVNVLATASVVPRRGCFIIDMSASVTRDTHVRRAPPSEPLVNQNKTPTKGRGSEFAYMLSSENPGESIFQDDAWDTIADSPNDKNRPTDDAEWAAFFNWADEDGLQIANVTQNQFRRMHFVDDYVKKYVMMDADYNDLKNNYDANNDEVRYPFPHPDVTAFAQYEIGVTPALDYRHSVRIDAYRKDDASTYPTGKTYEGAEPLKAIFSGLNNAMTFMQDRQVAGDEACLIFVDSRIWYTRFVTMTANFDYLKKLTDFRIPSGGLTNDGPGMANSANIVNSSTSGLELIVRHGLLPLGQGASKTNLSLAVTEAIAQLQSGNAANFASNFITVITDGLSNCRPCQSGDPCNDQGFDCNNDYSHFASAMTDLKNLAKNKLQGRNISLHFIMTGDAVGPNTVDVAKDASGTCMTDEELRLANLPYVKGGWDNTFFPNISAAFQGMSADHPFYEANVAPYEIAVGTQGLMGQIRPTPASPCSPHQCTGDRNANPNTWNRITKDPECRTSSQQMTAFMEKIIGDNPFTLVDVKSST